VVIQDWVTKGDSSSTHGSGVSLCKYSTCLVPHLAGSYLVPRYCTVICTVPAWYLAIVSPFRLSSDTAGQAVCRDRVRLGPSSRPCGSGRAQPQHILYPLHFRIRCLTSTSALGPLSKFTPKTRDTLRTTKHRMERGPRLRAVSTSCDNYRSLSHPHLHSHKHHVT